MKYQIMFLMFALILVGSANAEVLEHKQGLDYYVSFTDDTAGDCSISTIEYPNKTSVLLNQSLTKSGNTYTATISGGNFTQIGVTCWNYDCDSGYGMECVDIDTKGDIGDKGLTETILILIVGLIVCIFAYMKIDKFIGGLGFMVLGVGTLYTNPNYGWVGWLIFAVGFIAIIESFFPNKKMKRK